MIRALLKTARPRQWIKNGFVAAPVIFSKRLGDGRDLWRAAAATAIFCALSSAVYFWNDVVDLEKDRAHPTKKFRPIAAGQLPVATARAVAGVLAAGGLALGLLLSGWYAALAAIYLAQNLAYSQWLKRVVYVDVLIIAAGFLLRVVAGALAIDVWTSPYLLVCTGLLACFSGFGKRAHELAAAPAGETRSVLRHYQPGPLRVTLWLTGAATFVAYVLYTRAPHTIEFFHTTRMLWSAPFVAFGMLRFYALVTRPTNDSPTDAMLKDAPFVLNMLAWGATVTLIIYFRP